MKSSKAETEAKRTKQEIEALRIPKAPSIFEAVEEIEATGQVEKDFTVRIGRSAPWVIVKFVELSCPFCRSTKLRGYSTKPRGTVVVRYHQCLRCRKTFQSRKTYETHETEE